MKYKRFVYTPIILILTTCQLSAEAEGEIHKIVPRYTHNSKLERIIAMWNRSSTENFHRNPPPQYKTSEESFENIPPADLPSLMNQCIMDSQYQITDNFVQGKHVILNCFKTSFMLNMLRHLGESPNSSIKLLGGLLELERIPEKSNCQDGDENCEGSQGRSYEPSFDRRNEYVRMYKKAMEKLINERRKYNAYRNETEEERANQLEKIERNSQAFLSEVMRTIRDENAEKAEEEKLKREMEDPKLLSVLDVFSKNYMLKLRFYPGAVGRMMRSDNGGVTFDVEIEDSSEELEEESSSDESSTREIKDGPQGKTDYFDDDDDDDDIKGGKKKRKADKKKKKQVKKKVKELKKIIPYLLLPMLIQMTLLPFVFKKLFFLAMKALFAGKMALILVGFNLLRNTCIKQDDDYQKIRVEHYGYKKGEEYGAWINGRSLEGASMVDALSEEPYRGYIPKGGEDSVRRSIE